MTRRDPRKVAILPAGPYARPELLDLENLTVRVVGEGGLDHGTYRFSDLGAPTPLLRSLVVGFAASTAPGGRWRSRASVRTGSDTLRRLYRYLRERARPIDRVEDITPVVWAAWRSDMNLRSRWPGQLNSSRALLHDVSGVPADTRQEMRRRHRKPKDRLSGAYTAPEFAAIKNAAWSTVDAATERIRSAIVDLAIYRTDRGARLPLDEGDRRWGEFLEHLAATADPTPWRPAPVALTGPRSWHALFLTFDESFAFMVLFAALHGYNAATITNLTATHQRPDGAAGGTEIVTVDLVKGRRPGSARHATDNLVSRSARSVAEVYRRAVELTQPARDVLAALGRPTDRLLIARAHKVGQGLVLDPQIGILSRRWAERAELTDAEGGPLGVSLQRLRLTEQVVHGKPRQHSQQTHDEIYALREPQARRAAVPVIIAGLEDALDHARATVSMRTWSREELAAAKLDPQRAAETLGVPREKVLRLVSGALNTVVGGCLDFEHSPMSDGGPCTASFLLCLACPNAIATPDHLPRLVCLKEGLSEIASAVSPKVWATDYAAHYARLSDLLAANTTPEEQAAATAVITAADRELVSSLLTRRLDA